MKVLLIEPDKAIFESIVEVLEVEFPNCKVHGAQTEDAVRESLRSKVYDLIILDHYFAYKLKLIHLFKNLTKTSILIISSYKDADDHFNVLPKKKILKKPFSLKDLLRSVGIVSRRLKKNS